jgi:hypothetical protein
MWSYTISHSQLLLRSPKSPGVETRMDVVFANTASICIPQRMKNMCVREITFDAMPSEFRGLVVADDGTRLFAVTGDGFVGYVAAGAIHIAEDNEPFDARSEVYVDFRI